MLARRLCLSLVIVFSSASYAEFAVNTYTTDEQVNPAVAMDAVGNFVVVWESKGQDGDLRGIYGRRFDPNGQPRGGEFRVNVTTAGNQKNPDVAMDAAGNFVVTWSGTWTRRYNANGTPITGEFLAGQDGGGRPRVSMNDSGGFAVAWEWWNHPTHQYFVRGQAFDNNGTRVGSEFVVTQLPHGRHSDIAIDDAGEFAVAYLREGDSDDLPPGYYVRTRSYNADATPKGNPVQLTDNLYTSAKPSIAACESSSVVIWPWGSDSRTNLDVYAQMLDADGDPVGSAFVVNPIRDGARFNPSVAMKGDGQFLVVWPYNGDILGQHCDSDGTLIRGAFGISSDATGGDPAVAMNDDGRYVVVWEGISDDPGNWDVYGAIGLVPEPATLVVFACGALAMVARRGGGTRARKSQRSTASAGKQDRSSS